MSMKDLFGTWTPADIEPRPPRRREPKALPKPPLYDKGTFASTTAAIRAMVRGERVTYHTGDLATDRYMNPIIAGRAAAYLAAADNGTVILYQHRLGPSTYDYRAVRE